MIKRTVAVTQPMYLSTKDEQMVLRYPEQKEVITVPIEDLGVLILENPQITISTGLMERIIQNQVAVLYCNSQHMPIGTIMPLSGHSEQSERWQCQLEASLPLKKNLWMQTVQAKIYNQAMHLKERGMPHENMLHWVKKVQSGDPKNHEAQAAVYYWKNIFPLENFYRQAKGPSPNHLLNYGYAILRAITARALVASGMLPTLGIHHKSKYNAYCLADDIMEPYRPYVDFVVANLVDTWELEDLEELSPEIKKELLSIPALDVVIDDKRSPLLVAMTRTTSSLYACFRGDKKKIVYPIYET